MELQNIFSISFTHWRATIIRKDLFPHLQLFHFNVPVRVVTRLSSILFLYLLPIELTVVLAVATSSYSGGGSGRSTEVIVAVSYQHLHSSSYSTTFACEP